MNPPKKFWLHPDGRALRFLEDGKGRPTPAREGKAMNSEKPKAGAPRLPQSSGEILPPEKSKAEILPPEKSRLPAFDIPKPPAPGDIGPQLDAAVRRFEYLLETALQTFDLNQPEGFFDAYIIERKDHRINAKIARSARTVELLDNFVNALDAAERAEEKIRRLGRSQQQEYIERLNLAHTALMAIHRLQHAAAAAQRQDAVEAEKANALIEQYKADAREHSLRGLPRPAAPPPPAPPSPEDEAKRRRDEARRVAAEKIATELDAQEVATNAAEEKVARCKKHCVEVYQDPEMREGEKRARILEVLDQFNFKYDILPRGVAEFIEAGLVEDQNELA